MRIEPTGFTISIENSGELWSVMYHLHYGCLHKLSLHDYKSIEDFKKSSEFEINVIKVMSNLMDRSDMFITFIKEYQEIIDKKVKK